MAKSVYIAAIVSTAAILILVLFFIQIADQSNINQINEEVKQISLESALQSAYTDFDVNNTEVYCTVINQGINSGVKRLNDLERKLQSFKDNSFNSNDFFLTKRSYLITSMVLLRSLEKAKKSCDLNTKIVLFFYSEDKSCEVECGIIGQQLLTLQNECNTFKSFNFPYNWPSYDFTKILEVKYGVKKPGTLVIDENTYDSVSSMDFLKTKLGCS